MADRLEVEIKTYNSELPGLLDKVGHFVLIKGDTVVDTYVAYSDALKVGYERFGEEPFLVKRIAQAENIAFFTRDIVAQCPA